jgi:hypothetical protein
LQIQTEKQVNIVNGVSEADDVAADKQRLKISYMTSQMNRL